MSYESVIDIFAIVVNVLGFFFVIRQIRMQALATRGETYTSLCGLSYDILRMIGENPFLYDYVYSAKRLSASTSEAERVQVLMCCEMIANYCDNVALQRENIPHAIWLRWRAFIKEQVSASPELNRFLTAHQAWYSPDLAEVLREVPAIPD
jgi:hypothetical protein